MDFVKLQSAYRQYYNITEDAIVNDLALNTAHFARGVSAAASQRRREITDLYTDKLFRLFRRMAAGQGDYIKNPNPLSAKDEPYLEVGEGNGDLVLLGQEDYEQGFDWNEIEPQSNRSGQLLTWFIKNQMIGLDAKDIGVKSDEIAAADPEIYRSLNGEGKIKLDKDAALALTQPLSKTYRTLLQSVSLKYASDPKQLARYINFMQDSIIVPHFVEHQGEIIKEKDNQYFNVFPPACVRNGKINVELAGIIFDKFLADAAKTAELSLSSQRTYLDFFNSFKGKAPAKGKSLTQPLKLTLEERTDIMRRVMEPIFSLLCVLDDDFDIKMPNEDDSGGEGGGEGGGDEELDEPTWQRGEQVINLDESSPNYNKKGTITGVQHDPVSKKVISVEVTYWEEVEAMAAALKKKPTGDIETVYDPYKNLALLTKEGQSGLGSSKDKRKRHQEKKPEEKNKDKKGKSEAEPQQGEEGQQPEKPAGGESQPGKSGKGKEEQPAQPQDLGKIRDPFRKSLEDMIAAKERERNLREIEAGKKTDEYQRKHADKEKAKKLLQLIKEARRRQGLPENPEQEELTMVDLSNETIVKDYQILEKKIEPYANEMAKAWLEVINNISHKIQIFRDKYYPSGRPDIKKIQRLWPQILEGKEIDELLIYSRLVERIQTELRPRMLRLILLIDNSGSMSSSLESVRMCIMLLNSSLRSFRGLFRDRLQEILGGGYTPDLDLVCDTEFHLFGNDHKLIKKFDVAKLDFLEDPEKPRPAVNHDQETINTLLAFQRISVNEGTQDITAWEDIVLSCERDQAAAAALANGLMTEVVFEISDGDMGGEEIVKPIIQAVRSFNIATMGFAIGSNPDQALADLKKRHEEDVIKANTPQEIVGQFGRALKKIIIEQVEAPMERILDKYNEAK